jgi:hypothetical protein
VTSLCLGVKGRIPKFSGSSVAAVNLPRDTTAMPLSAESSRSTEMKTLLLAGTTVALLTAVNFAPAMAQGPKLFGGNTWAGISQRLDTSSANPAMTTAHYEYQYGYDKHGAWRGHWVLVR